MEGPGHCLMTAPVRGLQRKPQEDGWLFIPQVVFKCLTPVLETAWARQHRDVKPSLSCFTAASRINKFFPSRISLLFPNPITSQCRGGWDLDIYFYQNSSNFSWGISTANIPAGCSDSIWNVIRHQRHEGDQHLAYLEGAESGSLFKFFP